MEKPVLGPDEIPAEPLMHAVLVTCPTVASSMENLSVVSWTVNRIKADPENVMACLESVRTVGPTTWITA